ncbi:MAG: 8-oxo-dGTP diphosphatase [Streptococcaceae bacterium]|jgi:8-oxo-dGTP diphosphatase|nr:8-oxo-dGTP diphosphatase [Streptococcaceae bacterium]
MAKHEFEQVEMTNMCAIIDQSTGKVLVQNRVKSWPGIAFPGGHVEKGEAIALSTIREIKEETGLTVKNLKLCGIKDWFEPDLDRRYLVFLYRTNDFSGELIEESEEGRVFWTNIDELPKLNLASSFLEMSQLMLEDNFTEFIYEIDGDTWKKKFY